MRTSQEFEKLAVIPRNLYINDDFGGVEKPPHTNLIKKYFSDSARENGANKGFLGLAGGFKTAAMTALATTLSFGGTAYAQDNSNAQLHNAAATTQIINPNYKKFATVKGGDIHRKEVVRSATAEASDNQFAIVLYGINPQKREQAIQVYTMVTTALSEAQKDGSKVAFVIGTSDPAMFDAGEYKSTTNPIHVEIYQNGYLVGGRNGYILPYLELDDGTLMLNTDFASDMEKMFGLAKDQYAVTMQAERKQASNRYDGLDSFPN